MKFTDFIENTRGYKRSKLYESRSCKGRDVCEEDLDEEDLDDGLDGGEDRPCDKLIHPEKYYDSSLEEADELDGEYDTGRDYVDDDDDDDEDYDDEEDEDEEDYEDYVDYKDEDEEDDEDDEDDDDVDDEDEDEEDDEEGEDDEDDDYDEDEDDDEDKPVARNSVNEEIIRRVYKNVSYKNLSESDRRSVDRALRNALK